MIFDSNECFDLIRFPEQNEVDQEGNELSKKTHEGNELSKKTHEGNKLSKKTHEGNELSQERYNLRNSKIVNSKIIDQNQDDMNRRYLQNQDDKSRRYPQNQDDKNRRYPQRERSQPKHLEDYAYYNVDSCYKVSNVPTTFNDAMKSDEADLWHQAMEDEMDSLETNETFDIVKLPDGKKVVGGRWVYSIKPKPDGELYKARYVAKGYSQMYGIDYFETFAPTTRMSSIRILMQIAAQMDYLVHQMDVKSAYLNAPIDCEIYLDQPDGYKQTSRDGEKLVFRLRKSLYGLKQSANNWSNVLCDFFMEHDCTQSKADPCIYTKLSVDETLIYIVWVDDILVIANSETVINYGKDILKNRFKMKDMGEISFFLGIKFNRKTTGITMDQSQYLSNILSKFGMEDCKPRSTPCELKPTSYYTDDETIIDEPGYRAIIGSLIYAATCTRPDLGWIVSKHGHLEILALTLCI